MLRVSVFISTFICTLTLGVLSHNGRYLSAGESLLDESFANAGPSAGFGSILARSLCHFQYSHQC